MISDLKVGDESVLMNKIALTVGDSHLAPVDLQGSLWLGQRNSISVTISVILPFVFVVLHAHLYRMDIFARLELIHPFVEVGMGVIFADEDEVINCPDCGSDKIAYRSDFMSGSIDVTCMDCKALWFEVWNWKGVEMIVGEDNRVDSNE